MQIRSLTRLCTIRLNVNFNKLITHHRTVGFLWTVVLNVSNELPWCGECVSKHVNMLRESETRLQMVPSPGTKTAVSLPREAQGACLDVQHSHDISATAKLNTCV